ncbi:3-hydroxyisobutyryl-CoA hydrolase 1 [Capsicum annuum]|nr:3-hydroxyisobutyryl-CoA hydrolase 1 [Capsicum annuum]
MASFISHQDTILATRGADFVRTQTAVQLLPQNAPKAIQIVAEICDYKIIESVLRYQLKQFVVVETKVILSVLNPAIRVDKDIKREALVFGAVNNLIEALNLIAITTPRVVIFLFKEYPVRLSKFVGHATKVDFSKESSMVAGVAFYMESNSGSETRMGQNNIFTTTIALATTYFSSPKLMFFYSNLEDKVLFQDGSIVVNQVDFVLGYGLEVVNWTDPVEIIGPIEIEEDSNVKLIILKGHGRAFCAGGDVSLVFHNARKGNWKVGANYLQKEYILNYVMATYSKPQVSILNGIVMGGGAGASIHGRFRVATEKSVFSMPETAMGLFPDVGASYFLSRLPESFGEYAGLTGARLDGAEMLACGLATHFVSSDKLPLLEQELAKVDTSDPDAISAIISRFSNIPKLKEESPCHRMKIIDHCFSPRSMEEIISTLESEALDKKDGWISSTIQLLKKASPTSLKITLKLIREGRLQGVGSCLVREYRVICHVLRGEFNRDILEGFRAILIDKDRNPKWEPSRLELISDDDVDRYLSEIDDEDWEDLKLPPRSNLPSYAIAKL